MYMHIGEFIDYGHISDFAMLEIFFFYSPVNIYNNAYSVLLCNNGVCNHWYVMIRFT